MLPKHGLLQPREVQLGHRSQCQGQGSASSRLSDTCESKKGSEEESGKGHANLPAQNGDVQQLAKRRRLVDALVTLHANQAAVGGGTNALVGSLMVDQLPAGLLGIVSKTRVIAGHTSRV